MALSCTGPLICRFFSVNTTTVLHSPSRLNPRMQKCDYGGPIIKPHVDFQLPRGLASLAVVLFKGQLYFDPKEFVKASWSEASLAKIDIWQTRRLGHRQFHTNKQYSLKKKKKTFWIKTNLAKACTNNWVKKSKDNGAQSRSFCQNKSGWKCLMQKQAIWSKTIW